MVDSRRLEEPEEGAEDQDEVLDRIRGNSQGEWANGVPYAVKAHPKNV